MVVSIKRICENIGISFPAQYKKLDNDSDFSCSYIATTALDGKTYKMLCLPLNQYHGWLYTISTNRVKPEIRDLLSAYKKRSTQVLFEFWTTGAALSNKDDQKI